MYKKLEVSTIEHKKSHVNFFKIKKRGILVKLYYEWEYSLTDWHPLDDLMNKSEAWTGEPQQITSLFITS